MTDEEIDTSDIPPLDEKFLTMLACGCRAAKLPLPLALIKKLLTGIKRKAKTQSVNERSTKIYAEAHREIRR
jgi:hypothetical protein